MGTEQQTGQEGHGFILTSGETSRSYYWSWNDQSIPLNCSLSFQDVELQKVHAQHEAELDAVGKQVLSYWEEHPAFWLYFSVKEELYDDFWTIVDHMTGEEHLLHSPGVGILLDDAGSEYLHFVCLMQPNGGCLQTIGQIKYNHLPVDDFKFYCSLFKPEEGLKAILSKYYIQFWQLDMVANKTSIKHNGYELGYAWQPFSLPEFDTAKLGGKWNTWKHDAKVKHFIKGPDPIMDKLPSRKLLETHPLQGSLYRRQPQDGRWVGYQFRGCLPLLCHNLNRAYWTEVPESLLCLSLYPYGTGVKTNSLPLEEVQGHPRIQGRAKKGKHDFNARRYDQTISRYCSIYKKAQLSGTLDIDAISKVTKLTRRTAERLFRGYDEFVTWNPLGILRIHEDYERWLRKCL